MADPKIIVGGVIGGLVYLAFLGSIVYFSLRWSRRLMNRKADALRAGLDAVGGKRLGDGIPGGLYSGNEVEYDVGGRRVFTKAYYVSRSSVRVNLRVPGGPYPYVTIFPEGNVDRFGKAIGLNHEVQTGDKAFDDLAYIDTIDTDETTLRLLSNPAVRDALRELLALGYRAQFSTRGVEAYQIVYGMKAIDGSAAGRAATALGHLADHAPAFPATELKPERRGLKAAFGWLLIAPIFGVMFAGFLSGSTDRTLDGTHAAFAFIVGGGGGWLVYVIALALLLRGHSYAMRMLLVGALMAMFGVPAVIGSTLLWLNQSQDPSAASGHEVVVRSKHHYKSDYSVKVDSWRDPRKQETVHLSSSIYKTLDEGAHFQVRTHPGAFGWEWVERVTAP